VKEWNGLLTGSAFSQGPDALFETISQALLNAVDRDALSGWGAHVYIIEKDKVTKRLLKGRQD
jgi:20S proteasome subunit beta 3